MNHLMLMEESHVTQFDHREVFYSSVDFVKGVHEI